jgi:hypothetical protein
MGIQDIMRRLGMRARGAWHAWRGTPGEPTEEIESDDDGLAQELFGDEKEEQKREILEDAEEQLEGEFNALLRSLRGGNGGKKH